MVTAMQFPVILVEREDYAEFKAYMAGETLPESYDDFLLQRKRDEENIQKAGRRATRIFIKPSEFIQWCLSAGQKATAASLQLYAELELLKGAFPRA